MAEEPNNLVDLVHAQGLLALFQFPDKAQPNPCPQGKFGLGQPGALAFVPDKCGQIILWFVHESILHPFGYIFKQFHVFIPFRAHYLSNIGNYPLSGISESAFMTFRGRFIQKRFRTP